MLSPIVLTLPLTGGLIGWFTNWIAVQMLFRPVRPRRFLTWTIQGVIPRRRDDLIRRIAATVGRDLLCGRDLARAVADGVDWDGEVRRIIHHSLETNLERSTFGRIPLVRDLAGAALGRFEESLVRAVTDRLREHGDGLVDRLGERIDVEELVRRKLEDFDHRRLEFLMRDIARHELRMIEVLGGVIGFAIGTVQILVEVLA
jgi:uncharacterized membrane protein YheB (UPF0754 family)